MIRQPQKKIPIHPTWNVPDCDSPAGAIDWPRLVSFLRTVKDTGMIPSDYRSDGHSNEQKDGLVRDDIVTRWRDHFERLGMEMEKNGQNIVWGFVEGFLLYWNDVRCSE